MKKIVWFIVLIPLVVFSFIENTEVIKEYYENGNIKKSTSYRFNQKNGVEKIYYKSGNIEEETTYKNSKKNGIKKIYDFGGKVELQVTYLDDKKNGTSIEFYETGNKRYEIPFINDNVNGVIKEFDENGTLIDNISYINNIEENKILDINQKNTKSWVEKAYFEKCAACHGSEGTIRALGKSRIIAEQPYNILYKKLKEYKNGDSDKRENGILMKSQITKFNDNEIKILSVYISQMKQ